MRNDRTRVTSRPGMGLPIELWYRIIKLLRRDPITLLACALTCRNFQQSSQKLIDIHDLRSRRIDSTSYDDTKELAEEMSSTSKNGRRVHSLAIDGASWIRSPEVAISIIPHRLFNKFPRLSELCLKGITGVRSCHPSTWKLYGRAFSSVTILDIHSTVFPSFVDFTSLIISFPALSSLSLHDVRCTNRITPSTIRSPKRRTLQLKLLALRWMHHDEGQFIIAFSQWFFRKADATSDKLEIDETVTSHLCCGHILGSALTSFRSLEIKCRGLRESSLALVGFEGESFKV